MPALSHDDEGIRLPDQPRVKARLLRAGFESAQVRFRKPMEITPGERPGSTGSCGAAGAGPGGAQGSAGARNAMGPESDDAVDLCRTGSKSPRAGSCAKSIPPTERAKLVTMTPGR